MNHESIAAAQVRPLVADDLAGILGFFERVPVGDRTFFRQDVLAPGVVAGWLANPAEHRMIAVIDGAVAGHVAVIPGVGWSAHVGELRLVVDPRFRRRGLGRLLAQRAVLDAIGMGISKLVVEVVAEQAETVAMFTALGFEPEALLKDHVRDQDGQMHDLLVLAHFVEQAWATAASAGFADLLLDQE